MGRSPSVRRLSDKLHSCIARGFYLIPHSLLSCISAIKRFGSDQALEPRVFQPGDVSDHPLHEIAANRKISQPSALFMSDSSGVRVCSSPRSPELGFLLPPSKWLLTWTSGIPPPPSLIFFTSTGDKRGRGKGTRGEQKTRFSFALNLSGSGNPEHAIHRVVEPEIDHTES
jgi:hypothetical protein